MKKNVSFVMFLVLLGFSLTGCLWTKKNVEKESKKKHEKKHIVSDAKSEGIPLIKNHKERKTFREDLGAYDTDVSEGDNREEVVALAANEIKDIENEGIFPRIAYEKSDESLRKIYFDYDSSSLRDTEEVAISYNAKTLQSIDIKNREIVAEGNSDDRYLSRAYNIALSEQRARSAAEEIAKKAGIDAKKIKIIGYGSEKPAIDAPGKKEPLNRRVEFEVIEKRNLA